ncbi:MAG: hypothetical protein LQ350_005828 [Teloschistes chrysophthalmus]|nr:MAG: hypothetical protein LQ350_005828 [Niorma chrysophthalma]
MNTIREIQRLNKLELENAVAPEASWHRDHADSAYIYIGGLPFDLSEGDIITIFSQFGEPTFVKLVRDKETGKSKGFAFLKYEDQRSTDLAVDNLGGATIMGRTLKVDHTKYKKRDDEEEEEEQMQNGGANGNAAEDTEKEEEAARPMLKEEKELAALLRDQDEDDPMKKYLIQEKRAEVEKAIAKLGKKSRKDGERRKHRHHHKHRSRKDDSESESDRDRRRHKHRSRRDSSANNPLDLLVAPEKHLVASRHKTYDSITQPTVALWTTQEEMRSQRWRWRPDGDLVVSLRPTAGGKKTGKTTQRYQGIGELGIENSRAKRKSGEKRVVSL